MKPIPTADEYMRDTWPNTLGGLIENGFEDQVNTALIEFAQMHVKAALEAAAEKATTSGDRIYADTSLISRKWLVDKDSIINAYPLTLIV